ncbi:MAG: T9SS type A sorting domain-containing protein, partial [Bacteroidota bacterium]|nr:T9SS type A sorting domain-containing protein [Bacteroidota bacterium]
NPLGVTSTMQDTLWGALFSGDIDTIQFFPVDFSSLGIYSINCIVDLAGDLNSSNDTVFIEVQSIGEISTFPFNDDFQTGNDYFLFDSEIYSKINMGGDTLENYLVFTGGDQNLGWSGGASTDAQNAWVDNVQHIASATTCNVDASQLAGLTLEFDLKQTSTYNLVYSWFRLLINDTLQLMDINGDMNFNPATTSSDIFETKTFNLNAYAGTNFTLTFQSSCKYDSTYSGNYPEGDQVLIDNIQLYEPLLIDAGIFDIQDPQGIFCGGTAVPVNLVLANYGISSMYDVPVDYTVIFPDSTQQTFSVVFTDTIAPGGMVNYTVGSVNTIMPGQYQITASTSLINDGDISNDSYAGEFVALGDINSFPFNEDFAVATNYYFGVDANSLATAYYFNDNGDIVLRMEGSTNTGWTGWSGSVTAENAWTDNVEHHSFAQSCNVDATGLSFLNLSIDFRQTGITTITDYSWFRVLINDTIQIADLSGQSNFNPISPQGDPYQEHVFSLSQFAGTQFTLTLQASCKYDSTLTSGGTTYVEGDAVYIRNIALYEPPPVDIWVTSLSNVPEPSCDLGVSQSITVNFINNGTDTIFPGTIIPFNIGTNGIVILEAMTVQDTIVYSESSSYTFNFQPNLSTDGDYNIISWSVFPGDSVFYNDTAYAFTSNIIDITAFPYTQDFEINSDGWSSETIYGNDIWELGLPAQSNIDTAHSGVNAWMTDLDGNYPSNAEMYLYSPCFDFTGMQSIMVSFWLNIDAETDYDGMILEGSSDGIIWIKVGINDPNFYNSSNNASSNPVIEAPWWSGNLNGWNKFTGTLNEFGGESSVRLRFRFESDNSTVNEGIAMDDFMVDEIFSCSIEGNNQICEGGSSNLFAMASGGDTPYTYLWTPSTGLSDITIANPVASPATTTSYTVYVTDNSGDQAVADITITVLPPPNIDLGANIVGNPPFILNAGSGFISYFWSTFETTETISVSLSGLYSVTVTDVNGCEGYDTIEVTIAGIDEIYTEGISLFPNPNSGIVNCAFSINVLDEVNVSITDILGQVVKQEILPNIMVGEKLELDLSNLSNGTYMLYMRNEKLNFVEKIIIQK